MELTLKDRFPYLLIIRPANIVTAMADILAGTAISGLFFPSFWPSVLLLLLSTSCLYAGGIVFNDVFDADTDARERPERMIPSGRISIAQAMIYGLVLLGTGIVAAWLVGPVSAWIALGIALCALFYDRIMKHHGFIGPLFMGMCRAGNLLLGISLSIPVLNDWWWLGFLPLLFIFAVTLTSRGENTGANRRAILVSMGLDTIILLFLLFLISQSLQFDALPFALLWGYMNFRTKIKAWRVNTPENVKHAVKTGVISLIPLDACYAVAFGNFVPGLIVLALLPLSLFLARKFAVT